jgi:hypothetical protein
LIRTRDAPFIDFDALTSEAERHLYRILDISHDWDDFENTATLFAKVLHPRLFSGLEFEGSRTAKWLEGLLSPCPIKEELLPGADWDSESESEKDQEKQKPESGKEREEDYSDDDNEDEEDWGHLIDELEQPKTKGGKKTKKDGQPKPDDGNGWVETRQGKRGKQRPICNARCLWAA